MRWLLIGYMFLFIHRPFELWPVLGDLHVERVYILGVILAWAVWPGKTWFPNLQHLAYLAFATAGYKPEEMGLGPVYAIPKALKIAGLKLQDIDVIELNEAFAAQSLAVIQEAGLDPARVNPNGGAIALGHPLGCTGAKLTATLIRELGRRGGRYGMVTMCVGGGMGAAGIFERRQKGMAEERVARAEPVPRISVETRYAGRDLGNDFRFAVGHRLPK